MKPSHIGIIAVCFGVGFAAGKWASPGTPAAGDGEFPPAAHVSAISAAKDPPREATFEALIESYARRDAALDRGDYLGQIARTRGSKGSILSHWATTDPAGAWEWVQANAYPEWAPGTMAGHYDLFGQWTRQDPAAVAEALAESPDRMARASVQRAVVEILVGDDAELAGRVVAQLDELLPGPVWYHRDRGGPIPDQRMLETVQALPESAGKGRLRHQLMQDWFHYDWDAASAWVAGLPPREREALGTAILESGIPRALQGATDGAARWLAGNTAPPGALGLHSREVVKRWAKSDPVAANGWVAQHHVGATRLLLEAEVRAANPQ